MKLYRNKVKENWYCFLLGPLFMTMEAAGEFLLPFLNANLINYGAAVGNRTYILKNGFLMLVLAAGMLLTGVLGAFFAVRGAVRLAAGVRQTAFEQIQTFSFSQIDRFSTGSLITRVTNDISQIQNFTQSLLRGCFRSPIMLLGALVMSFYLNPRIGRILALIVLVLGAATFLIIRTAAPRYTAMQLQLDRINTGIEEAITNHRVIKAFVREEYEKEKFFLLNGSLLEKSIRALKMMILLQPVSNLAIHVTTLLVVWTAGRQIMVGDMEVGTLAAFITYLSQVLTALNFMANIFLQGTRASASHKRILEIVQTKPEIEDPKTDRKQLEGEIIFQNVSFSYVKNAEKPVLQNISLTIREGEFIAITGSTGSGKSTFVSLLARFYEADRGQIRIGGQDIREIPLEQLRQEICMVLQKNTLFSGTIEDNLRWAKKDATPEELEWACKIACAHDFITAKPEGYQTRIGQGGNSLSGGQKQRLCIARALLRRPRILILDDSTSAVDMKTDEAIRKAFEDHLKGVTRLMISQRASAIRKADRILVLEEGRVAGFGTHEELLEDCLPYREICGAEQEGQVDKNE